MGLLTLPHGEPFFVDVVAVSRPFPVLPVMFNRKLISAGVGTAAILAFGLVFAHVMGGSGFDTDRKLQFAMSLLDEGRWDIAGRLARELDSAGQIDPETNSAWHYVQGVSKLQAVQDELDTPRNRQQLWDATEHLKRSEELGFPLGYQGKGRFYLGFCYFNTYRWDDTIRQLEDSAEDWPERRSDALRMVVEAELSKQPPDFEAANRTLATWQAIPGMSESELARIQLSRAHADFLQNDMQSCEQLLSSIAKHLPEYREAQIWRGRWRLEAAEDERLTPAARDALTQTCEAIFREVIIAAETPNALRRQATYLSGRNLRVQNRLQEALGTFSGVRQRSPRSAEAFASGIEEAEILFDLGLMDDVVTTAHHFLRNIENLDLYNGYWVPLDQLRARLLVIGRGLRDLQQYDRVIQFADYMALAFPPSDSVRLKAETYEKWGHELAAELPAATPAARALKREATHARFLLAAETYEQLAALELRSSDYPEILWHTIENFQAANQLDRANQLLDNYLRFEDRTKRPRGFLALGRNHMDAGEWTQALEPLERCLVEYPTNPISFEARLLAANANSELDHLDEAIELLQANLGDYQLDPTSQIWQDSLYELGQTIFRRGDRLVLDTYLDPKSKVSIEDRLEQSHADFEHAIQRLGEAVSRYPEDPRYYDTRYLVAKSYRLAAETPEQLVLSNDSMIDTERRRLMQQRRALLEKALGGFQALHQSITSRQDAISSTERNMAIVRNCYFGEADCLFDLGRYDDAIQAYRNAASRFLNQPESLEALVQMAVCHRKMGREFEANKTLAQAEQVLRRIPPELDSHFVAYTRGSRQEWSELIGWLRGWN